MTDYTKLRELLAAAPDALYIEERPNSDGTVYIDDGLSNGIFPIVCESPQAELIVALHNAAEELIEKAEKYDEEAIKVDMLQAEVEGACNRVELLRKILQAFVYFIEDEEDQVSMGLVKRAKELLK